MKKHILSIILLVSVFFSGCVNVTEDENVTYTITFNKNNPQAVGTMADQKVFSEISSTLVPNQYSLLYHSFAGWSYATNGAIAYSDQASITLSASNVTLYAVWTNNMYTVTFDKNHSDAIGSMEVQYIPYSESSPLFANTFSCFGRTFTGWSTNSSGNVQYTNQASFRQSSTNSVLYAIWTNNIYPVTFEKNAADATGTMAPQPLIYSETGTLAINSFQRTGYSFAGWATTPSGTVEYADQAAFTLNSTNAVLYAVWTNNVYTITYEKNEPSATGTMTSQHVFYQQQTNLLPLGFSYNMWGFVGWALTPPGTPIATDNGSFTLTNAGDITLYAQWSQTSFTVTFYANGGSAVDPVTVFSGGLVAAPSNCVKADNLLAGWYTDPGFTSPWNFATATITSNVSLYAKWVPLFSVTFDPQGGTAVPTQTITNNGLITLPEPPVSAGSNFSGWYTSPGGATQWNFTADRVSSNTMLYAKWEIATFTVTFDSQPGPGIAPQTVQYNGTVTQPAQPVSPGHIFHGWYKDNARTAEWNFAAETVTGDTTIYAKWEPIQFNQLIAVPSDTYLQQMYGGGNPSFNHYVTEFHLAQFETTYKLWHHVYTWATNNGYSFQNAGNEGIATNTGAVPSAGGQYHPVTSVSWRDVVVWCNAYSEMSGLEPCYYTSNSYTPGTVLRSSIAGESVDPANGSVDNPFFKTDADGYRLPTEGEWQLAATYIDGTNQIAFDSYSGISDGTTDLDDYVWYSDNSGNSTHQVGGKLPNPLQIYDMTGNVWEWTWDWYAPLPDGSSQNNYRGPSYAAATIKSKVNKGGNWIQLAHYSRVGYRKTDNSSWPLRETWYNSNRTGFRIARNTP